MVIQNVSEGKRVREDYPHKISNFLVGCFIIAVVIFYVIYRLFFGIRYK